MQKKYKIFADYYQWKDKILNCWDETKASLGNIFISQMITLEKKTSDE